MFNKIEAFCSTLILVALIIISLDSQVSAMDSEWRVSQASGDASINNQDNEWTPLAEGALVGPGHSVRTGRNGRVLLIRGQESILVAPNSVVGIPTSPSQGLSTTIHQWTGSILIDVEKRGEKHFEVITPYLAAVVKGTQFRVNVNGTDTSVEVLQGQVEVAEFKSGKFALVWPGQTAMVSLQGTSGLLVRGAGSISPVQQGASRISPVNAQNLPKIVSAGTSVPLAAVKNAGENSPRDLSGGPSGPLTEAQNTQNNQNNIASPSTEIERVPAWARTPANEGSWTARFESLRNMFSKNDDSSGRYNNMTSAIALGGAVWIVVSVIFATQRRWRKRKRKSV